MIITKLVISTWHHKTELNSFRVCHLSKAMISREAQFKSENDYDKNLGCRLSQCLFVCLSIKSLKVSKTSDSRCNQTLLNHRVYKNIYAISSPIACLIT